MRLFFATILFAIFSVSIYANDFFPISFWYPPKNITEETMREVYEANFTMVFANVENQHLVLDLCDKLGMKVLVNNYPTVLKNLTDENYKQRMDEMVSKYSEHPALWGYYLVDEPTPDMFDKIKVYGDYLREKDPNHIVYSNLFPNYVGKKVINNLTYDEYINTFLEMTKPQILSFDNYPYLEDGNRKDYFANLESIREASLKHNIPFMAHIQSVSFVGMREPNEAELRFQVYSSLAYGCKGILYFTYATPEHNEKLNYGQALINEDGTKNKKYNYVKNINAEVKNLSGTLLSLTSKAVYHTRAGMPVGTKPIPYDNLISTVTGGSFVIGQFTATDCAIYAMVVNKNLEKKVTAYVSFSKEVSVSEIRKKDGKTAGSIKIRKDNLLNIPLKAGEGILFKIE